MVENIEGVKKYDLFSLSANNIDIYATGLALNGSTIPGTSTPFTVATPATYVQVIDKVVISNGSSSAQTVTLYATKGNTNLPLLSVLVPASASEIISRNDFDIIVPSNGYNLTATESTSAPGVNVYVTAHFEKGTNL